MASLGKWLDVAPGKRGLGVVLIEGIRRYGVNARLEPPYCNGCILFGRHRNARKGSLLARAFRVAVEIERKRVEELELPVILEEAPLLDPGSGARVLRQLGL